MIPNEDSGRFYYRTAGQPPLLIPTSSTTTSTHKQEYDGRMQQQVQEEEEQNNSYTHIADIKRTFANDLDTYKSFLGILDLYRRNEQEVLEEVFVLFAGHPVLLRDFAYYFLPDNQ